VSDTGSRLELQALSSYLDADYPASVDACARAHGAYRGAGDALGAARTARMLAWIHGNVRGEWAVGQGWVRRALTALSDCGPDTTGSGWSVLMRAWDEPDPERQKASFTTALDIARRAGDRDLEYEALGWVGIRQVFSGQVNQGMNLLDETLAAVCAGDVRDLVVIESAFCAMLWACETVQDVSRAEQWIRASEEMCRRRNLPAMTSFCRAHYGSILTTAGRWPEAEAELTKAIALGQPIGPRVHTNALVRLAELRVRQGRFEEAEQLLKGLDRNPDAVRPLAALHHSRGELELAQAVLGRGVGAGPESCSDLALLTLLVEVALDRDEPGTADRAAARLEELAAGRPEPCPRAYALFARGLVDVSRGDPGAADALDQAVTGFAEARMPWELARSRLELARVIAADRPDQAVAEARSALESAEALGATRLADAAAELLRSLGVRTRTGRRDGAVLTRREAEVLALVGHGLSNPEISDRLYISRKTVEHHVSNILVKLGLRSRAEAAGYAARHMSQEMGELPDSEVGSAGRS
jgi:DNA-binding CsgD family transcriptional regulator